GGAPGPRPQARRCEPVHWWRRSDRDRGGAGLAAHRKADELGATASVAVSVVFFLSSEVPSIAGSRQPEAILSKVLGTVGLNPDRGASRPTESLFPGKDCANAPAGV